MHIHGPPSRNPHNPWRLARKEASRKIGTNPQDRNIIAKWLSHVLRSRVSYVHSKPLVFESPPEGPF
eukprot:163812-Alexandrium_andersonii.AAC.1